MSFYSRFRKQAESLIMSDRSWEAGLWALFIFISVTLFFFAYYHSFGIDEYEHIHSAWKISQGKEIYVDFFQHHHPFYYYMLLPIIDTFGSTTDTIMVSRYLSLVFSAAELAVTYFLALALFKRREIGILSLILTATLMPFYARTTEVRPDVPQALFGVLSVYFLVRYYDKKSIASLVLSSVSLAVSFLFLQKAMVLMAAIGGILVFDIFKKRIEYRHVIIYIAVFAASVMPYYIYLAVSGSFSEYYTMNWVLNARIPQVVGKLHYLKEIIVANTITCVFYAIGLILLFRSRTRQRFAVLTLVLTALTLLVFKNLWHQYQLPVVPLAAIIAAYALYTLITSKLFRLVFILGVLYVPLSTMHNFGIFNMDRTAQAESFAKIEYVLSLTREGDKVYDGNALFNLYRDDVDYFWFCLVDGLCLDTYQKMTGYKYDIYDLIYTQKPKVISTFRIPSLQDIAISGFYRQSDKYPDLYIRIDE